MVAQKFLYKLNENMKMCKYEESKYARELPFIILLLHRSYTSPNPLVQLSYPVYTLMLIYLLTSYWNPFTWGGASYTG